MKKAVSLWAGAKYSGKSQCKIHSCLSALVFIHRYSKFIGVNAGKGEVTITHVCKRISRWKKWAKNTNNPPGSYVFPDYETLAGIQSKLDILRDLGIGCARQEKDKQNTSNMKTENQQAKWAIETPRDIKDGMPAITLWQL